MNSDDGDIGCVVYRWGFRYLDYPLDVSTPWSIIWAYTASFVHTYIYRVFSVFITCCHILSHVYVYLCSLYCFSMHIFRFRLTDIHVFTWSQIYCHFSLYYLSFPVPACLNHITWSCTRVPVMHAIWLYNMYSLGLLTTLDSHVQILESRPCWSCCSWSECAADPPMVIGVQQ